MKGLCSCKKGWEEIARQWGGGGGGFVARRYPLITFTPLI